MRTTARPCSSSTLPISPTFTPATCTVWPCPGVTACAFSNSAYTCVTCCHGKRSRWCTTMYADTASESTIIPNRAARWGAYMRSVSRLT
jgi:hypothetical protein